MLSDDIRLFADSQQHKKWLICQPLIFLIFNDSHLYLWGKYPTLSTVINNFILTKPLADGSLPSPTAEVFASNLANPNTSNFDVIQFVIPADNTIPDDITYSLSTIELAADYGDGGSPNFGILLNVLDIGDRNSLEGPATLDANITVQVQLKAELVP